LITFFFSASSVPYVNGNGGITATVVKTGEEKKKPYFKVEQPELSPSNTVTSFSVESFHEPKTQDQSTMPTVVIMPTVPPATVPPHFPETTRSTSRAYSGYDVV
jgi:hypothetical protein